MDATQFAGSLATIGILVMWAAANVRQRPQI